MPTSSIHTTNGESLKHIGLFEGIGGFSLAARWMGWETIAWCEWNEFGQKVLKHHFPKAIPHGDITKTDFTIYRGSCDILTGGFPCQPYSQAGKRKGKEDDRHLWPEMLRAIREIQPTWVVGENVFGLVNWSRGLVFHEVQADLEAAGYEVFPYVLPACAVNAPHRRDRVWFVAYRDKRSERSPRKSGSIKSDRDNGEHEINTDKGGGGEYALNDIEQVCNVTNTQSRRLQKRDAEQLGERKQDKDDKQFSSIREWENFPTQPPVRSGDDGFSSKLDGLTFSKHRTESIKAYGNAIVPQVAYEIFKVIEKMNKLNQ